MAQLERSGTTTQHWRTPDAMENHSDKSFPTRTLTAFTVGVEKLYEAAEFWGSARDADDIPEGYAVDAVEGGFKIYECDV